MNAGINLEKCGETNSDGGLPLLINEFYSGLLMHTMHSRHANEACSRSL